MLALVAVAAVAATACSGSDDQVAQSTAAAPTSVAGTTAAPPTSTTVAGAVGPDPFVESLAGRLGPDGEIDRQLALDLFASAYGVDLGEPTTALAVEVERTLAAAAVFDHWATLSADQQATVMAALAEGEVVAKWDPGTGAAGDFSAGQSFRGHRGAGLPPCFAPGTTGRCTLGATMQRTIERLVAKLAQNLGRPMTRPIIFAVAPPEGTTLAEAVPSDAAGNPRPDSASAVGCRVTFRVQPAELAGGANARFESTLVHELFHCFQFLLAGFRSSPAWLVEGSAAWVEATVEGLDPTLTGPDGIATARYTTWFSQTPRSLFNRSYDAVGFWQTVEQWGVSPWSKFDRMLVEGWRAGSMAAVNALAPFGSQQEELARLIASSRVRQPALGARWELAGTPATPSAVALVSIPADSSVTVRVPLVDAYGSFGALVTHRGDVFSLKGKVGVGVVGFEGGSATPIAGDVQGDWCTRPGGCTCGEGTRLERELLPGAPGRVGVGLGQLAGLLFEAPELVASSSSLDQWCLRHSCVVSRPGAAGPARAPHADAVPRQDVPDCPVEPTDSVAPGSATPGQCVVGRWVTTKFIAYVGPGDSASGGDGAVFEFRADGSARLDFTRMQPYRALTTGPDHGERIENSVVYLGASDGRWALGDGGLTVTVDPAAIRLKSVTKVAGVEVVGLDKTLAELGAGAPGGGFTGFTVSCNGSELLLTRAVPGAGSVPASTVGWALSRA